MTQEFDLGCIRGGTGPAGPAGAQGPAGPAGPTPSISVGRVTMLGPEEAPYIRRRADSPDLTPVLDFGLPSPGAGCMNAAVYDPRSRHQDVFAYCDAHAGRPAAAVTVAAADSRCRELADFVCDGTADHITIGQAIAALPETGGRVVLLEGSYMLDHTGAPPDGGGERCLIRVEGANVSIMGQGPATRLVLDEEESENDSVCLLSAEAAGFAAAGFSIDGGSGNGAAAITGLRLGRDAAGAAVERMSVVNCGRAGVENLGEDADICRCTAASCGSGLLLSGSGRVRDCVLRANGHGVRISGGCQLIQGCGFYDNTDSGVSGSAGNRCLIRDNILWGQPLGLSLSACRDCLISGNLIFRGSGNEEWAGGEYPLLLTACQRPHAVGNLLRGKAAELTDCISPTLSYSGNDWNPTA